MSSITAELYGGELDGKQVMVDLPPPDEIRFPKLPPEAYSHGVITVTRHIIIVYRLSSKWKQNKLCYEFYKLHFL